MKNPILKRGSRCYGDVERLQLALIDCGYAVDLDAQFGPGVEKAVCALQESEGLPADGVVDGPTWDVLATKSPHACPLELDTTGLHNFRGNLHWLHQWEGHAGRPYWPGGVSGVTLDPGLDLGHADPELVERVCGTSLDADAMACLHKVLGLKGDAAREALDAEPALGNIRILRNTAARFLPIVAKPYWDHLCRRFDALASPSVPASVQTALLSLGYNRGPGNRGLEPLAEPLSRGDWLGVADVIGAMQQDHQLEGIRRRRQAEAALIRDAVVSI